MKSRMPCRAASDIFNAARMMLDENPDTSNPAGRPTRPRVPGTSNHTAEPAGTRLARPLMRYRLFCVRGCFRGGLPPSALSFLSRS